MANAAAPFLVFAGFLLLFVVQARRDGVSVQEWLRRRSAATSYTPGWWKPMAVVMALIITAFIVVNSIQHGFRWTYLLTIPIVGGFLVLSTLLLLRVSRRRFDADQPKGN